jgi:hypothetical protein
MLLGAGMFLVASYKPFPFTWELSAHDKKKRNDYV